MTMEIIIESGLNGDGFTVRVTEQGKDVVFQNSYRYGYNVSYSKEIADIARKDYENAKKYHWSRVSSLKPYVRDVIDQLCAEYGIRKDQIQCRQGKTVFKGGNVAEKEVNDFISKYIA